MGGKSSSSKSEVTNETLNTNIQGIEGVQVIGDGSLDYTVTDRGAVSDAIDSINAQADRTAAALQDFARQAGTNLDSALDYGRDVTTEAGRTADRSLDTVDTTTEQAFGFARDAASYAADVTAKALDTAGRGAAAGLNFAAEATKGADTQASDRLNETLQIAALAAAVAFAIR